MPIGNKLNPLRRASHRRHRRTIYLYIALSACVLLGSIGLEGTARADTSCENPHCYANEFYYGSGLTGMFMYEPDAFSSIGTGYGDAYAHINSESWLLMPNGTWLEAGLRNGSDVAAYSGGCHCVTYAAFWEDINTGGTEYMHIISHLTPDGVTHSYEFDYTSGSSWDFYFDGNYVSFSSATGSSSGHQENIGGEYQNTTCVAGAGQQYNTPLHTQLRTGPNNAPNWFYPSFSAYYVTQGCGLQDRNGPDAGEYQWQKHAP